jgi:hypothetical protein
MSMKLLASYLDIASKINEDIKLIGLQGKVEPQVSSFQIIPESLVINHREYIKRIVREINGTYENALFTACGVLIRRLFETCMIEAFEFNKKESIIKELNGEYKTAEQIKNELLKNPFGNISRSVKRALGNKDILEVGHNCAHDRFFTARKYDIDKIRSDIRYIVEYLMHNSI